MDKTISFFLSMKIAKFEVTVSHFLYLISALTHIEP